MIVIDGIAWLWSTHPKMFTGWVGLWVVDLLCFLVYFWPEASGSASACKIEDGFIEWKWET